MSLAQCSLGSLAGLIPLISILPRDTYHQTQDSIAGTGMDEMQPQR